MKILQGGSIALLVVLLLILLSGCDDGPECLDHDTRLQTVTTFNGKTTSVHVVPVTVCTRYAEEK